MRTRTMLSLLLSSALACSGSDPSPTELRPEFVTGCSTKPTISPAKFPIPVTVGSTGNQATFAVKNNCSTTSVPWDFTASRTGQVKSVGTPNPGFVILSGGQTKNVSVTFEAASSSGSGTVVLTATWDGPPITTTSGTQAVTVSGCPAVPPGGCIGVPPRTGQLLDISGNPNRTTIFQGSDGAPNPPGPNNFAPGTRVEAGLGTALTQFKGTQTYQITHMGDADDWSWHGGLVIGQLPDDGSVVWDDKNNTISPAWHSAGPGLPIAKGKRVLVDQFSARNKSDGISLAAGAATSAVVGERDGSVLRWCVLEDMHDDGIENDWKDEITVYGSFISSVSGISTRPVAGKDAETNPAHKGRVMTLDNSLIWLKAKRFKDEAAGVTPIVFRFWKWQVKPDTTYGMKIRMRNLVLRYDNDPQGAVVGGGGTIWGSLPVSLIDEQTNVVVVFTKLTSGFPTGWPPTAKLPGFTYFYNVPGTVNGVSTSSMAKTRWNQAVANLQAQKPSMVINQPGTFAGF